MRTARVALGALLILTAACTDDGGGTGSSGTAVDGTTVDGTGMDGTGVDGTTPSDGTVDDTAPEDTRPVATAADGTPLPDDSLEALDWGDCPADANVSDDGLECATLTVPLDHAAADAAAASPTTAGDDADVATIDLALVRVPATRTRVGAILFNPGGPGGSGFDYIAQGGRTIVSELNLQQFDLIGFDPRGVDRSGGIACQTDAELDRYEYLDTTPDTPEEQALLDESETAFADACRTKYGDTLRFYSTEATARDMDLIRRSLGDATVSYLGVSYGTYLGAVYATLFPDRVRAMVLDSAYEPTGDTVLEQYSTQLVGFEDAFDTWASWCETTEGCAFDAPDVGAAWDALRDQLDAAPVPNADGRLANQSVLDLATIAALYSETDWPVLADALARVRDGDAAGLFSLADGYNQRDADGHYASITQSNPVISCASGFRPDEPDDPEALLAQLKEMAPRFAADLTVDDLDSSCNDLVPPVDAVVPSYTGRAPIVVVAGNNDPATPIRWAEELTTAMGPRAVLVTSDGEGHGQLLRSSCVDGIEGRLLTDLERPDPDTVCEPDPDVERPDWWDSLPVPPGVGDVVLLPALSGALGLTPDLAYAELRTTQLDPAATIEAYDTALVADGFVKVAEQEPFGGTSQGIYAQEDGDIFTVLAIGQDALSEPELESAADVFPATGTLVVLLYLPQ